MLVLDAGMGSWDGVEHCGARDLQTNMGIHRFDPAKSRIWEEQGGACHLFDQMLEQKINSNF